MKPTYYDKFPSINSEISLAVIGHIEWVSFLHIDKLPEPGAITHGEEYFEGPAGGGVVAAIQLSRLINNKVKFYTALGDDEIGRKSYEQLSEMGLELNVAWRQAPTRRAISLLDKSKERSITVIGERIQATGEDDLPWNELSNVDGVFVCATDHLGMQYCRKAKTVVASPRIGKSAINKSGIEIDALIGSSRDNYERKLIKELKNSYKIAIETAGEKGGFTSTGKSFESINIGDTFLDTYGCGDSFAAAITLGISSCWRLEDSLRLGSYCGARCAQRLGPY